MEDIKAGKINIVVVYKIDRLTRALMDFSKLVEVFDQHGVTFVSITQRLILERPYSRALKYISHEWEF